MYYVVPGAAGFIGSRLVGGLNRRGISEVIAVDNLAHADKFRNLAGCEIADYVDQAEFIAGLERYEGAVEAILHQGACSDTMETDGRYMIDNIYGYSKFLFDQLVRRLLPQNTAQVAGFRYFNVYGPNESHKGRMASVAYHAYQQLLSAGKVKLFVGSAGYGNGEQRRDFVYVEDVVDVNLWLLERRDVSGVFNCGTGRAQSFNELAAAGVNASQGTRYSVKDLVSRGLIEYVAFPPGLLEKYQSYTQADLGRLRAAGYSGEFRPVEEGVAAYMAELQKK